ncbi:restriction endonuclease subunit S [Bifidobacterium adolescentis]|uniref:restriction endonuclease subunit S n=1 Tax=Bifidobacterium adolescentis TaxID=1680 RepID=UPI00398D4A90
MAEQHEKALVPQIRFTGFTDPWEQRKLGELFVIGGSGGTPSATNASYYGGDIPFLGISDIKNRDITITAKSITEKGLENSAAWIIPAGSICLAMYASVGKAGINRVSLATSQAFYNMVFEDETLRDFIYTRLEKADTDNEWNPLISTGTQANLNADKVKSFRILLPSSDERRLIAKYFADLDSLITLHQRKYDKLCVLKKSMLDKMFPKGGSLYPEIRFAGFTDPWEQRKLGELTEIKDSARIPNRLWREAGVPYIRASDISQEDLRGALFIDEEDYAAYKAATGAPEKGDVLFNGGGEIGKAIINGNSSPIYVQGGAVLYARIAHSSLLDARYLVAAFVTQNVVNAIGVLSAGGTMKHFTLQPAKNLPIEVPSIAEQRRIGAFFDRLDSLITLHQRKLELLRNIKKSMLDKMFV